MREHPVYGLLAAIAMIAAAGDAYALTVDCTSNPDALRTAFSGGGVAGTQYQITGPCNGNFTVSDNGITIVPNGAVNNTINGEIFVSAARGLQLVSLVIDGSANSPDATAVFVHGPAFVIIMGTTIQNSIGFGIDAVGPVLIEIDHSTVTNSVNDGARARDGATILMTDMSGISQVTNNHMFGVRADDGASIRMQAVTVSGNLGGGVAAQNGSTIDVSGGSIDSSCASCSTAIAALAFHSSSVSLSGVTGTGPAGNHTIAAIQSSSVILNGSNVTADTPFNASDVLAVVAAARGSTITLAGGNTVTNSAVGGTAALVSEGSTLVEDNGTPFGFAAAADTVNGDGRVNTQSVIELGAASGGGSITWAGNVVVSQFSSFRADGDNVTVTGTLSLGQAANAYFNHTQGASNAIAQVVCNSTTDHVANPTFVTPNVMIGNPPACQPF